MYWNLLFFFGGGEYLGGCFAKITRVVFSGLRNTTRLSLQIGLSTCIKWWEAWRPLACYAFIKIKLASCHYVALMYVVYTWQKSFNFINTFACYKQKCKLPQYNLAHPVHILKRFNLNVYFVIPTEQVKLNDLRRVLGNLPQWPIYIGECNTAWLTRHAAIGLVNFITMRSAAVTLLFNMLEIIAVKWENGCPNGQ